MINDYITLTGLLLFLSYIVNRSVKRRDEIRERNLKKILYARNKKRNRIRWFITSLILTVLVTFFDYKMDYGILIKLFYLIPIILTAWFVGRNAGFIIVLISTASWLMVDLNTGNNHLLSFSYYWDAAIIMFFFLLVVAEIQLEHTLLKEKKLGRVDRLTGLHNKRSFHELADKELKRCKRYNHALSVAFLDCDDFKDINRIFGHKTGDNILREVAYIIRSNARESDIIGRLGPDEFVVLLTETGAEGSLDFIKRLKDYFSKTIHVDNKPLSASFGLVTYKTPPPSVEEMLMKGETLIYSAKRNGGSRIEYYEELTR